MFLFTLINPINRPEMIKFTSRNPINVNVCTIQYINVPPCNVFEYSITDLSGKTCLEQCKNEECKQILKAYLKLKEDTEEQKKISQDSSENQIPGSLEILRPPKPPIVRGTLWKIGTFLLNLRERYFVINPEEGTLIRYKLISHYPLRPLEVIPLKDITHIQMITKSWFMSSEYTYFEINYPARQVLACKNEQAAKKWFEYLFQACVYSYYMESK